MSTRRHTWIRTVGALASVAAVLLLAIRLWPSEPIRTGSVVAYHVVDDNTAFLLWRANEGDWKSSGWLSRVDSKGRTAWLRRIPAPPELGDALRVGRDVVAVRYASSDARGDQDLSMIAFGFNGEKRWDRVLGPYYPKQTGHGPTFSMSGGATTNDYFVEWFDSEKEVTLVGLAQRTGVPSFSVVLPSTPTRYYAFASRLVWFDDGRAPIVKRATDSGDAGLSVIRGVDLKSGAIQQLAIRGRGCVLDGEYVGVVSHGEMSSLVSFPGGDLEAPRIISERVDPFGDGRVFSLQACGRHDKSLVFLLESAGAAEPEVTVVVTDAQGTPRRSMRLKNGFLHGTADELPERFESYSPLNGDLSHFVPVLLAGRSHHRGELAVLDLAKMLIVARSQIPTNAWLALFKSNEHSYMSEKDLSGSLNISVIDGSTGGISAAIRATPTAQHSIFERPLLPPHVGSRTVWLVPYMPTPVDRPPVTVLDGVTLRPLHTSEEVALRTRKLDLLQ